MNTNGNHTGAPAMTDQKRITLSDKERHDIRWSQRKTAFVGLAEFARGRRGGKFRPVRSEAFRELDAAVEWAEAQPGRYRQQVVAVTIYEVDALGYIQGEVAA